MSSALPSFFKQSETSSFREIWNWNCFLFFTGVFVCLATRTDRLLSSTAIRPTRFGGLIFYYLLFWLIPNCDCVLFNTFQEERVIGIGCDSYLFSLLT